MILKHSIGRTRSGERKSNRCLLLGRYKRIMFAQVGRLEVTLSSRINQLDINCTQKPLSFSLSAEDENTRINYLRQTRRRNESRYIKNIQDTWALKQSDEFGLAATNRKHHITSNQSYANTPKADRDASKSYS